MSTEYSLRIRMRASCMRILAIQIPGLSIYSRALTGEQRTSSIAKFMGIMNCLLVMSFTMSQQML